MSVIHPSRYEILEVMDLPDEVQEELECPGNDTYKIVNPEYHPKLSKWLTDNGYEVKCYLGRWSW